jgi:hypothetical protein
MKNTNFWYVRPSGFSQRAPVASYGKRCSEFTDSCQLDDALLRFSETSVITRPTLCNIQEGGFLQNSLFGNI